MSHLKLGQLLLAAVLVCVGCGGSDSPVISKTNTAPTPAATATPTNAVTPRPKSSTSVDPNFPVQPQPRLRTMKVWVGAEEVIAEIAATEKEVMTGMMARTEIQENEGMLFIFRNADPSIACCVVFLAISELGK